MKHFTNHHLYEDLLEQVHVMIAGATGSGKSVVINGMLTTAIYRNPKMVQFILIDPKRVELIEYADLPHTVAYASEPADMIQALQTAMKITEARYLEMQAKRIRKYDGGDLYVEVKGQMTELDALKINRFAEQGGKVLVVGKIPEGDNAADISEDISRRAYSNGNEGWPYEFNFETIDGDHFAAHPGINKDGRFELFGDDSSYLCDQDDAATERAYRLARQARFEHRWVPDMRREQHA